MRCKGQYLWLGLLTLSAPAVGVTLDEARDLHRAGRLRDAVAAYRSVARAPAVEPETAGTAHNNACVALLDLGDHRGAETECREALRLRRQIGDPRRLGRTLNNLGLTLRHLGRLAEAEDSLREAYELNLALDDVQAQAVNLVNRATVAIVAGAYDRAIGLLDQTGELTAAHADQAWVPEQRRVARLNRGVVLEKLGAFADALEIYRQLLEEGQEVDPRRRASLAVNIGVIYRNLGDPVTALQRFEEAAELYGQAEDRSGLSNAWLNIALARHLNLGQLPAAERAYRQALALAEASGDRSELVQDLFYLGQLLAESGRLEEAEELLRRCLREAVSSGSAEGRWSARAGLGSVALSRGRPAEALIHLERAIGDIEGVRAELEGSALRSGFFGDKRPVYAAAIETLAQLDRREPGRGHARRALDLVQRAKARDLLDAFGPSGPATMPVTADALRRLVGADVLLELFAGRSEIFGWEVRREGIRFLRIGESGPLQAAARRAYQTLASGGEPDPGDLERLGRDLLGALRAPPGRGRTLWIAPDGALSYLPFELLPTPWVPAASLVERSAVAYLPSGSTLAWLGQGPARPALAFAGFADPELPEGADRAFSVQALTRRLRLPGLAAARREVETIGSQLPGNRRVLLGEQATEEALRQLAAGGVGVLHLAAHAVVEERIQRGSALLLAPDREHDGVLYPDEIARLSLPVGLTVLAACSTRADAGDPGRALSSLTGSFLAAGSAGVVATLWDVEDQATAAFMEQFYYFLRRGKRPAEALRRAKLRMRSNPAWASPGLWSGYVLVGKGVSPRGPGPRGWWWVGAALVVAAMGWRWLRWRRAGVHRLEEPPGGGRAAGPRGRAG